MKIALCLSGQPRFLEICYKEVIKPFILDGFDIDVFIHTWKIDSNQIGKPFINSGGFPMGGNVEYDLLNKVQDIYKPTSIIVENQIQFETNKWCDRALPGVRSDYLYSMFYSIFQSNKLKTKYEIKNNFKYDWVIRSRFDVKLNSKINFYEFNNSVINVPSGCFDNNYGYVDCLAFSNSNNMNIYSDTYNNINKCMNNDINLQLCGEYILRRWLDTNNIPVISSIWHSLYR